MDSNKKTALSPKGNNQSARSNAHADRKYPTIQPVNGIPTKAHNMNAETTYRAISLCFSLRMAKNNVPSGTINHIQFKTGWKKMETWNCREMSFPENVD
ncbi:MAG: hypothetical protein QM730_06800 [Anaerolineales bacterium]